MHHLVGRAQGLTTDSGTVIHHRDFNRLNNSPDNLALLTRGEHAEVHRDYETGLEHGRQAMFAEDGQYREAIREKNRRLMVAYNANQGLAKAFQALSQLEKRNLALTIENYETLRGEIYNLKTKAPKVEGKCDICGGELTQRKDDNEETAHARFDTYFRETAPLVDYYKNKQVLSTIDADGSIDEVWERLLKVVE